MLAIGARLRRVLDFLKNAWAGFRGAEQAAEKRRTANEFMGGAPAGAKARPHFAAFAARVNSCPVTKLLAERVFPQPVKPLAPSICRGRGFVGLKPHAPSVLIAVFHPFHKEREKDGARSFLTA
jgi:hypothetical protein